MMTESERALLRQYLTDVPLLVEFGSGASTVMALKLGVQRAFSIESDPAWIARLTRIPIVQHASASNRLTLIHADLGPTDAGGYPSDNSHRVQWPHYYSSVWEMLPRPATTVLVDGRFRVACALQAARHGDSLTRIIVHDYWSRPAYHALGDFLELEVAVEELAVFRIPTHIDHEAIDAAIGKFFFDAR